MRPFTSVLLVATVAVLASAQSSPSSTPSTLLSPASDSPSLSAELAAIAECTTTQLDEAQVILTSNQREKQCETALNLESSTMLQVTTASATKMCDTASCKAALLELYNALPNCRYDLWGLQYSAKQLLEYCGITPTNTTVLGSSSGSVGWSVTSGSTSSTTARKNTPPTARKDTPSTANSPTAANPSSGASSATAMTIVSAVFATSAGGLVAVLFA